MQSSWAIELSFIIFFYIIWPNVNFKKKKRKMADGWKEWHQNRDPVELMPVVYSGHFTTQINASRGCILLFLQLFSLVCSTESWKRRRTWLSGKTREFARWEGSISLHFKPHPLEFCLGANIGSSVFVPPAFSLHILWIKGMKKTKLNTSAIIEEYTR